MSSLKECTKCREKLPLEKFYREKRSKDGRMRWCSKCVKDYVSSRYHSNPEYKQLIIDSANKHPLRDEYQRRTMRKYRRRNKEKINEIQRVDYLLKRSGLREFLWKRAKGFCELCGEPICRMRGRSNYAIHHLDGNRQNNDLENLIVVCTRCHLHKLHHN